MSSDDTDLLATADAWVPIRDLLKAWIRRARRVERREVREFRRWLERTSNLVHLSVLFFVPFLIGVVTLLSNALQQLSFLLFPPLASGTYTLFANPEGRYASPTRFVGGLTIGAICGWLALEVAALYVYRVPPGQLQAHAFAAALAVFLTGVITWPLDVEEPSAFSTALLTLLVPGTVRVAYVGSVFLASSLVAAVFYLWREQVYEQRAEFLYESTKGDDHVLVPMRGSDPESTAMLGARLAAAHDAGKVVLLDLVSDESVARAERKLLDEHVREELPQGEHGQARPDGGSDRSSHTDGGSSVSRSIGGDGDASEPEDLSDSLQAVAEQHAISETVTTLEMRAGDIETQVGVPCEVVVAVSRGNDAGTVRKTAREVNCDLVAASYEEDHGSLSPFLRKLFRGDVDVMVHRSKSSRARWKRILVPVRRASDVAHSMVDFACRLAGPSGRISAATCIRSDSDRRRAEEMLADLVEPFEHTIETRVAVSSIESFLEETTPQYDLVIMGASTDRSTASRLISPPTFERIQELESDVAIVDRS